MSIETNEAWVWRATMLVLFRYNLINLYKFIGKNVSVQLVATASLFWDDWIAQLPFPIPVILHLTFEFGPYSIISDDLPYAHFK